MHNRAQLNPAKVPHHLQRQKLRPLSGYYVLKIAVPSAGILGRISKRSAI
jgi:hypothetical protein